MIRTVLTLLDVAGLRDHHMDILFHFLLSIKIEIEIFFLPMIIILDIQRK